MIRFIRKPSSRKVSNYKMQRYGYHDPALLFKLTTVTIEHVWEDMWIGLFWQYSDWDLDIYLAFFSLVLHIRIQRGWKSCGEEEVETQEEEEDVEYEAEDAKPALYTSVEGDIEDHMQCPGCGADLTNAHFWSDHTVWCSACEVWRPWPKEMMGA